ncbi:MAG: hypothetical protein ACHQAQ_03885 [Hyphomicrobiales bacterium]
MRQIFGALLVALVGVGATLPFAATAQTMPVAAPQASARQLVVACRRPPSVGCLPGTHGVPGGTDANGCQLQSSCVADAPAASPTACRLPPSVGCLPGTHGVPGGKDARGCQLQSTCVKD